MVRPRVEVSPGTSPRPASGLLGSPQDDFAGTPDRRTGHNVRQFISCNCELSFLLSSAPVRERTGFNTKGDGFVIIIDRVRAEMGYAALNNSFVLFWDSRGAISRRKFRQVRPKED